MLEGAWRRFQFGVPCFLALNEHAAALSRPHTLASSGRGLFELADWPFFASARTCRAPALTVIFLLLAGKFSPRPLQMIFC
jgi:hypothetical protein